MINISLGVCQLISTLLINYNKYFKLNTDVCQLISTLLINYNKYFKLIN